MQAVLKEERQQLREDQVMSIISARASRDCGMVIVMGKDVVLISSAVTALYVGKTSAAADLIHE